MYEDEAQNENGKRKTEKEDANALKVDVINLNGVNVRLISCDHEPEKLPEKDPWQQIENEVEKSSLVFVEYFPYELEQTVYKNPVLGKIAKKSGEKRGIQQEAERRVKGASLTYIAPQSPC